MEMLFSTLMNARPGNEPDLPPDTRGIMLYHPAGARLDRRY
jgi:hypothetical protein